MFVFQKKNRNKSSPTTKIKKPDPSTKTPTFQRIPTGPNGSENVFTRCDYASNFSARDQLQYFRTLDLSERVQALQRLLLSGAAGTLAGISGTMGCWWWFFRVFCLFDSGGSSLFQMLVVRKQQLNPLKLKTKYTQKRRHVWKERWFTYHKNPSYTPVSSWQEGCIQAAFGV